MAPQERRLDGVDAPVSVIVPVHNTERYLGEALESALQQTLPPLEIIVVDDGSTDGSAAAAARFGGRVMVHHQSHQGAGAARNHGTRLARAPMLAFLDADDVWTADKLERQCALLRSRPDVDGVFGHARLFLSPDLGAGAREGIAGDGLVQPAPLPSALLIRRESFHAVGPFSEALSLGEPLEWYARATERGLRMAMLTEVILRRRLHPGSQGVRKRADRTDYARILGGVLQRRRQPPR